MYFILYFSIQVNETGISEKVGNGNSSCNDEDNLQIKCKICFSEFVSVSEMDLHFQLCKKMLVCDICNRNLKMLNLLKNTWIFVTVEVNISVQFVTSVLMMIFLVLIMYKNVQENSYVRSAIRNLPIGNCY